MVLPNRETGAAENEFRFPGTDEIGIADKNGDGEFTCTLTLPKGRYEYKFVINGTWCADPECTDWVQNDMGTLNSVKVVD